MKALAKIQQELNCPKSLHNKFGNYKYRSCESILEAVKPLLKEHNCTLTLCDTILSIESVPQMIITDESTKPKTKTLSVGALVYVEATAVIKCGDEIESSSGQAGVDINKAGMDTAQCFGASSSYARKYALNGLFLIDDTKDADATNKHGKDDKKQTLADYKKEMKAAKDGKEVQTIAKKYSATISDVWNTKDRDEAANIYQSRIDEFVLAE